MPPFVLAHLSDPHGTTPAAGGPRALCNKRLSGWLSWHLNRKRHHRKEVLEALLEDLSAQAPAHVVVTGDLVNLALPAEFAEAARWLRRLGTPERVSLVPGNHDAYVRVPAAAGWGLWDAYMAPDPSRAPSRGEALRARFPWVRVRAGVALVGLCSALPTAVFRATGRLGPEQLARLEETLVHTGEAGLLRTVLVHHPVLDQGVKRRKSLLDAAELRAVLARAGAELVLHGHRHRFSVGHVPGPGGPIPVVGVRSASYPGPPEDRRAQYHLYELPGSDAPDPRVRLRIRAYDASSGRFVAATSREL